MDKSEYLVYTLLRQGSYKKLQRYYKSSELVQYKKQGDIV